MSIIKRDPAKDPPEDGVDILVEVCGETVKGRRSSEGEEPMVHYGDGTAPDPWTFVTAWAPAEWVEGPATDAARDAYCAELVERATRAEEVVKAIADVVHHQDIEEGAGTPLIDYMAHLYTIAEIITTTPNPIDSLPPIDERVGMPTSADKYTCEKCGTDASVWMFLLSVDQVVTCHKCFSTDITGHNVASLRGVKR